MDLTVLAGMEDQNAFLGLDRAREGLITLTQFKRLFDAVKGKKPAEGDEQIMMGELRLTSPEEEPTDVVRAMAKWCHIARWMSAASQRSIALRMERLMHGWVKDKARTDDSGAGEPGGDVAAAEGADASKSAKPKRKARAPKPKQYYEDSMMPEPTRRRPMVSTPRELTLESLAAMREQEMSLKQFFNAVSSQKLPDGTPEMTRADLHLFFKDLQLADYARHKNVTPDLLDRLYDEALSLQCNFTRIGNGLTFWSMKVVLNIIIGPLGLGWRRLVEATIAPEALEAAAKV